MERTERINVRCTPYEKKRLMEKAAHAGMTLSGFLIWEALGEELGQMILDGMEVKENEMAEQLAR